MNWKYEESKEKNSHDSEMGQLSNVTAQLNVRKVDVGATTTTSFISHFYFLLSLDCRGPLSQTNCFEMLKEVFDDNSTSLARLLNGTNDFLKIRDRLYMKVESIRDCQC